jgi:aspartate racemase
MLNDNQQPMLGIMGGNCSAAINLLQERVKKNFLDAGAFRNSHLPQMLIFHSTFAPSPSLFYEANGESFVKHYKKIAKHFEDVGVSLIAICSNTAHAEYDQIISSLKIPTLNIIEETLRKVRESPAKKIALLATEGCIKSGVYQLKFNSICPTKNLVLPSKEDQKIITEGIKNLFRLSKSRKRPFFIFKKIIEKMKKVGCDAVIFGCTDISVDFKINDFDGVEIIDSLQILADSIAREIMLQMNGNKNISKYYRKMSSEIKDPIETKQKAIDGSHIDAAFILQHSSDKSSLLDLGSGTGLILNKISQSFAQVCAVEKYSEFSSFIDKKQNLKIINADLLEFYTKMQYSVITIFGVLNYFNLFEATKIYRAVYNELNCGGTLIIKHQMGINSTLEINGFSAELDSYYYSQYRTLSEEIAILSLVGFRKIRSFDIYPKEYNRFKNTHFYAIVCCK